MGIRIGAGTQLVFDDYGNFGILDYRFVGGSGNFTILDVPVSIGADYIFGVAQDGSMVSGISVSFSGEAAFPIEMHGTWVISTVYEIDILELMQNAQKLYKAVKGLFQRLSCD